MMKLMRYVTNLALFFNAEFIKREFQASKLTRIYNMQKKDNKLKL